MMAPERGGIYIFQSVLEFEDFVIGCRPTHPDVVVTLQEVLKYLNVYVDGNIRNPALPVMPRQYQKYHYCLGNIRNARHYQ